MSECYKVKMNQIHVARNMYQGETHKLLCVCSAGVLRSPTAAKVLGEKYGFNTRAAGMDEAFALIPVSEALLIWADEIVCFTYEHSNKLEQLIKESQHVDDGLIEEIQVLSIEDNYGYMDKILVELSLKNYQV